MMGTRKVVLAVLVAFGLLVAACGSDGDDQGSTPTTTEADGVDAGPTEGPGSPAPIPLPERTSVTVIPVVAIEPFAPAYLAEYFGEFDKENLDVTVTELPTNDSYVALTRGDTQLQIAGLGAGFFNLVESGTGLRWLANVHHQSPESKEGLWVRNDFFVDGEIDEAQIPGMSVAFGLAGVASTSALPIAQWLEEYGYDFSDIEVQSTGGNDVIIALEQGAIDAGYVLSPAWQTVEASGCCTLVTGQPPLAASTYAMTEEFMENDRETAKAIMRALLRTVRTYLQGDYHEDPEVLAALVEVLGVPEESILATPSLVFDPEMMFDSELLEEIQQVWIDNGVLELDAPMPRDEVVDSSVVEEVKAGE
jgi:NitT/TauT family transport system substrate-binding protein